ncbi:MAG: ankyrin repeat domain-containing protein [Legionellaceae bacterium]|nr:ankyrin repeat domain-containing protein [Legionellaceae bacterium]
MPLKKHLHTYAGIINEADIYENLRDADLSNEAIQHTCTQIKNGEAYFEDLHGCPPGLIIRGVRINAKHRMLFTVTHINPRKNHEKPSGAPKTNSEDNQNHQPLFFLVFLEILDEHKYKKSLYLTDKHKLPYFMEVNHDIFAAKAAEYLAQLREQTQNDAALVYQKDVAPLSLWKNKIIALDSEQAKIYDSSTCTLIIGPPGVGKTILLVEKMNAICAELQQQQNEQARLTIETNTPVNLEKKHHDLVQINQLHADSGSPPGTPIDLKGMTAPATDNFEAIQPSVSEEEKNPERDDTPEIDDQAMVKARVANGHTKKTVLFITRHQTLVNEIKAQCDYKHQHVLFITLENYLVLIDKLDLSRQVGFREFQQAFANHPCMQELAQALAAENEIELKQSHSKKNKTARAIVSKALLADVYEELRVIAAFVELFPNEDTMRLYAHLGRRTSLFSPKHRERLTHIYHAYKSHLNEHQRWDINFYLPQNKYNFKYIAMDEGAQLPLIDLYFFITSNPTDTTFDALQRISKRSHRSILLQLLNATFHDTKTLHLDENTGYEQHESIELIYLNTTYRYKYSIAQFINANLILKKHLAGASRDKTESQHIETRANQDNMGYLLLLDPKSKEYHNHLVDINQSLKQPESVLIIHEEDPLHDFGLEPIYTLSYTQSPGFERPTVFLLNPYTLHQLSAAEKCLAAQKEGRALEQSEAFEDTFFDAILGSSRTCERLIIIQSDLNRFPLFFEALNTHSKNMLSLFDAHSLHKQLENHTVHSIETWINVTEHFITNGNFIAAKSIYDAQLKDIQDKEYQKPLRRITRAFKDHHSPQHAEQAITFASVPIKTTVTSISKQLPEKYTSWEDYYSEFLSTADGLQALCLIEDGSTVLLNILKNERQNNALCSVISNHNAPEAWIRELEQAYREAGHTSIIYPAIEASSLKFVRLFYDFGISIHTQRDNKTPLLCALDYKHFKTIEFLVDHSADLRDTDQSILSLAVATDNVNIVKKILHAGVAIPDRIQTNNNAIAKLINETLTILLHIEKKFFDNKNRSAQTLHELFQQYGIEILRRYQRGPRKNLLERLLSDPDTATVLFDLLEQEPNLRNKILNELQFPHRNTFFHFVNSSEILPTYLQLFDQCYQTHRHSKNDFSETPILNEKSVIHRIGLKLIPNTPAALALRDLIQQGDIALINDFLNNPDHVGVINTSFKVQDDYYSPLMLACVQSRWDIVQLFLRKGANANIPSYIKGKIEGPLMYAAQTANIKLLKKLFKFGAVSFSTEHLTIGNNYVNDIIHESRTLQKANTDTMIAIFEHIDELAAWLRRDPYRTLFLLVSHVEAFHCSLFEHVVNSKERLANFVSFFPGISSYGLEQLFELALGNYNILQYAAVQNCLLLLQMYAHTYPELFEMTTVHCADTPMQIAINQGHKSIVDYLLNNGIYKAADLPKLLMIALSDPIHDIIELLLHEMLVVPGSSFDDPQLLHAALATEDEIIISMVLEAGVYIDETIAVTHPHEFQTIIVPEQYHRDRVQALFDSFSIDRIGQFYNAYLPNDRLFSQFMCEKRRTAQFIRQLLLRHEEQVWINFLSTEMGRIICEDIRNWQINKYRFVDMATLWNSEALVDFCMKSDLDISHEVESHSITPAGYAIQNGRYDLALKLFNHHRNHAISFYISHEKIIEINSKNLIRSYTKQNENLILLIIQTLMLQILKPYFDPNLTYTRHHFLNMVMQFTGDYLVSRRTHLDVLDLHTIIMKYAIRYNAIPIAAALFITYDYQLTKFVQNLFYEAVICGRNEIIQLFCTYNYNSIKTYVQTACEKAMHLMQEETFIILTHYLPDTVDTEVLLKMLDYCVLHGLHKALNAVLTQYADRLPEGLYNRWAKFISSDQPALLQVIQNYQQSRRSIATQSLLNLLADFKFTNLYLWLKTNEFSLDHLTLQHPNLGENHTFISYIIADEKRRHIFKTALVGDQPLLQKIYQYCNRIELNNVIVQNMIDFIPAYNEKMLNSTDPVSGLTPLDMAIDQQSIDMVIALIDGYVDIPENRSISRCISVFRDQIEVANTTAQQNIVTILKILLVQGIDINGRNAANIAPLTELMEIKPIDQIMDLIQIFILFGADISVNMSKKIIQQIKEPHVKQHIKAKLEFRKKVAAWIEHNKPIDDDLLLSCIKGEEPYQNILFSVVPFPKNQKNFFLLFVLSQEGYEEKIYQWLKTDKSFLYQHQMQLKDTKGLGLAHLFVLYKNSKLLSLLIENEPSPLLFELDVCGASCLHYAIYFANKEVILTLIPAFKAQMQSIHGAGKHAYLVKALATRTENRTEVIQALINASSAEVILEAIEYAFLHHSQEAPLIHDMIQACMGKLTSHNQYAFHYQMGVSKTATMSEVIFPASQLSMLALANKLNEPELIEMLKKEFGISADCTNNKTAQLSFNTRSSMI